MKSGVTLFRYLLIIIIFLFMSMNKLAGQGKTRITMGLGFPETINAGLKTQLSQSEVGASIGFWPAYDEGFIFNWENVFSVCGDYYYHFAGRSPHSDLRPYYLRAGVNYLHIKWDETDIDNLFNVQVRVGRDIYLSNRLGVGVDGGVLLHLNGIQSTWGNAIGWAAGACLFYRF